jgi:hypothetical protein
VLGDRLTDDGTQRWLAAHTEPLGALAEGLPEAGQPATELDGRRGSADHCRGQVAVATPRPGTAPRPSARRRHAGPGGAHRGPGGPDLEGLRSDWPPALRTRRRRRRVPADGSTPRSARAANARSRARRAVQWPPRASATETNTAWASSAHGSISTARRARRSAWSTAPVTSSSPAQVAAATKRRRKCSRSSAIQLASATPSWTSPR